MKRILVAGLGLIGERHCKSVLEHAGGELAAVVDPDPELRAKWDVAQFASLDAVDVPVDGAILATPSHMHADHAEHCLSRGWPCLIEKPIEVSLDAAERIVRASARTGLPVLTGHHRRYHASIHALRDILRSGEIGQPVLANVIWAMKKPDTYFQGNWRTGGGGSPVMINMVHEIDLLRFLLGDIVEVLAMGGQPIRGAERVENGVIALRFEGGLLASIAFTDTAPSPWGFEAGTNENPNIAGSGQDSMWIAGTKGGVSFPTLRVWTGAADWGEAPTARKIDVGETVPLDAQLSHFLDVLDGAAPLIDAEDAKRSLAITLEVEAQVSQVIEQAKAG